MSKWVRSGVLSGATDLVAQLGGNFSLLAECAGLRADALKDPDMPIDTAIIPRFLDLAAEQLDCPAFGLRLGQMQDMSLFGMLATVIQRAPTVGGLVRNLAELFPLHTQGAIVGLREEAGDVLLTYEPSAGIYPSHRYVVELGFSVLVAEFRRHCPSWCSGYISLRHAPPADPTWHYRILGPDLVFNADRNALLLDAALLAHPIAPAHSSFPDGHDSESATPAPDRVALTPFLTERLIRAFLPSRLLAIADTARLLRISVRTLQRRLAAAATSHDAIVDSIRADLAMAYLRDSDLTIAQIAETLQFSETSALSRAVRRWYQCSPTKLRQNGESH
ncbi:AraC family transcriptional regulator [Sphingomonas sp. MMSM20]|uniref:AraC family transcriptional regulator n=1 Tax=Sphingomonas lycopersici TaxID=2951807 RepID=UPI002238A0B3|nr:AraC family transcriptional regulator [Sphingomonas lycopersici]MCW6528639.1 AraC family transcriptional regulator [Sphingomonas lycopersici]